MSMRLETIQNINQKKDLEKFATAMKDHTLTQVYCSMVFTEDVQKKYILKDAYESLIDAIEYGKPVDSRTADFVAIGLRNWAIDNGATHYTHWFHPLTGKTAEKHDAFFKKTTGMSGLENLSGKDLIQQEPDASSFPHGGLRNTHTARGYTVWDPSSPPFIRETKNGRTLYIPAIFISYTGESLDHKTPLLKSMHLIDRVATDVVKMFNPEVRKVVPTLGWEQEYFIIDDDLFNARPDLVLCGRTLYGNASARGQQLEDHYFAPIPERILEFMIDFENEALKLGIPLKTRHNEVAPTQFECAPHFESLNISVDHNQLLMDIIDSIAKRHRLRALLHEKPFNGLNGSGKHNNWSMMTDTGENLLKAGDDPKNNLRFLTFFINIIKAVHENGDLIRASVASVGNEYRLGANEAPPSIISIYTGNKIEEHLNMFMNNVTDGPSDKDVLDLNLQNISRIKLDKNDRNRTSPFPFVGDKFEFRAAGSSMNVSTPNVIINTIVSNQLIKFIQEVDEQVNNGADKNETIKNILRRYLNESQNVIYNGDNYGDAWLLEAEKRGLPNIKSTPEALSVFLKPEYIEMFSSHGIFTESELKARIHVGLEEYIHKIEIEAIMVKEIAHSMIIPAAVQYQNKLIDNVNGLINLNLKKEANGIKDKIVEISTHIEGMIEVISEIEQARERAHEIEDIHEKAVVFYNDVKGNFRRNRAHADALELIVEDKLWPLPKYRELLFLH